MSMELFNKKDLVKQLQEMTKLVKNCPDNMLFHGNVEFSGLDSRFMELARQFNIARASEGKKAADKLLRKKGNI